MALTGLNYVVQYLHFKVLEFPLICGTCLHVPDPCNASALVKGRGYEEMPPESPAAYEQFAMDS